MKSSHSLMKFDDSLCYDFEVGFLNNNKDLYVQFDY